METDHIELNAFLKKHNLAPTGGKAKRLIRSGKVFVNNTVETRNKRKLFTGDRVKVDETEYVV